MPDQNDQLKAKNKIRFSSSKFKLTLEDNQAEASKLKTALYWICGIEHRLKHKERTMQKYVIDTSIAQSPFWANVCDVNAILVMAACGFFYAFFNKFN